MARLLVRREKGTFGITVIALQESGDACHSARHGNGVELIGAGSLLTRGCAWASD